MEKLLSYRHGLLAVIIPAFNEEHCVVDSYDRINAILSGENIQHKIIFVDDGSSDQTFSIIKNLSNKTENVIGVRFSRNFGKESAIYAGLHEANRINADCAVVIDCDLQHPPEKIIEMYHLWQDGYEVIEGVKKNRGEESPIYHLSTRLFYDLMSNATQIDMSRASDYKLLDRKAIITLLNIKEKNSFFRALSSWIGFRSTQVEYEVQKREHGQSKWSVKSLIKYAINNIASFTAAPMQVVTVFGVLVCVVSIIFSVIALVQKLMGQSSEGFTTVIILQLFTSSIIMISLGIIGYYISKIFEEVKNRPKFIVSETCGNDKKD